MAVRVRVSRDGGVVGDLDGAARMIQGSRRAAALTGAGISVESGIPDFRSPGGLWTIFDPNEYATLSCFLHDPDKAWQLYRAIGRAIEGKQPNTAHRALTRLEEAGRLQGVITQNVDGLHQAAGSRTVLEIHGSHDALHCLQCGRREPFLECHLEPGPPPRCEQCGFALKPTVVLFEEPVRSLGAIQRLLEDTDLLLVVGTSAQVTPASLFPGLVQARGGRVLEFNVEPSLLTQQLGPSGGFVEGPASVTLPAVVEHALSAGGSGGQA